MNRWNMVSCVDDWYWRANVNSRYMWSDMDGRNMSWDVDVWNMRSDMYSRYMWTNMNRWVMRTDMNWWCVWANMYAGWEWMPTVVWSVTFLDFVSLVSRRCQSFVSVRLTFN